MTHFRSSHRSVSGFTLVELAIALMIIGLLLGGVLKGRELITNARNAQVTRQLKGYEVAVKNFISIYSNMPGDIPNPGSRLPGCTSDPCNVAGNGDGDLTQTVPLYKLPSMTFLAAGESHTFWTHLAQAGLINGIDTTVTVSTPFTGDFGREFPTSAIENVGFVAVGYSNTGTTGPRSSYIIVRGINDADYGLTPATASYIDQKLDDGLPTTGDVMALANYLATGIIASCGNYTTNVYATTGSNTSPACNLAFRLEN